MSDSNSVFVPTGIPTASPTPTRSIISQTSSAVAAISALSSSRVSGSASASAASVADPIPENGTFPTAPIVAGIVGSVVVFGAIFAFYYFRERSRRNARNAAAEQFMAEIRGP